jgi:beta-barrel assembly-enhancing protease
MKMKKNFFLILLFVMPLITSMESCKKEDSSGPVINIFTLQDDIDLGMQLDAQIKSDPADYPLLNEQQYSSQYTYLRSLRDSILNTGLVDHDTDFTWQVQIIKNDTVLNAFCTPGGYMYFYTGLMKFLDNEAELAGVMGHEMTHAAKRHSTNQLTKVYGLQLLVAIVLGQNPSQLAQIAADIATGLTALAFSRDHEYQADEYSVKYLYQTSYDARGVGGFFEKLDGQSNPPQFLSTHPNPGNRVEKINEIWQSLGGKTGNEYHDRYQQFKSTLP